MYLSICSIYKVPDLQRKIYITTLDSNLNLIKLIYLFFCLDIEIPQAAFASSDSESETENFPRPPPEMQDCIDGILSTLKPRLERMWGPLQEQDKTAQANKKLDASKTDKNIAALSLQVQALWQRLGNLSEFQKS